MDVFGKTLPSKARPSSLRTALRPPSAAISQGVVTTTLNNVTVDMQGFRFDINNVPTFLENLARFLAGDDVSDFSLSLPTPRFVPIEGSDPSVSHPSVR